MWDHIGKFDTYCFIHVLRAVDADKRGDSLNRVGILGVVDEAGLSHGAEFDASGVVNSSDDFLFGGLEAGLAICLSENVLRLDTLNVAGVARDLLARILLNEVGLRVDDRHRTVASVAGDGVFVVRNEHQFKFNINS